MKKRDILGYLCSFVILAISFVFLLIAFHYQSRLSYFVICTMFFALFCVVNKLSSKKITCEDGYNLVQAYMFYNKCKSNGLIKKPSKLTADDLDKIKKLSADYDFAEKFDLSQVKELYRNGYETEKILKKGGF